MLLADDIIIPTHIQQLVTNQQAWDYSILPKETQPDKLVLYVDESKACFETQNQLELIFGKQVEFVKMPGDAINKLIGRYYRKSATTQNAGQRYTLDPKDSEFIYHLIAESQNLGCSDIHIEAFEETCRIRLRIDGNLIERYIINKLDYSHFINKMKIKANLDISEKRLPQDGRIFFETNHIKFDIRVSVIPGMFGEKIVLRLLSKDTTRIELDTLGFSSLQYNDYLNGIKKPHGIILISGPTGSGKTTTLYATLKKINNQNINILTVEDPVEYTLEGVTQVQLKESIGLTFSRALRSFLRQDPDVIMLGEIRDSETANMAIRAALTGHLVLSTIHTNSAIGTISRLIDMGIPPFLIASTLSISVAQRLIRILCPECKTKEIFDEKILPKNYKPTHKADHYYKANGCDKCFYTGYYGRKAIYEVISVDRDLAMQIRKDVNQIEGNSGSKKFETLADMAYKNFTDGNTSIEEIYPIIINDIN